MRRRPVLAAALSLAVLGGVIALVVHSAAVPSAKHDLLTAGAPGNDMTPTTTAQPSSCRLAAAGTATPPSGAVHLSGACLGDLTEAFACIAATDDLYLSARHVLDRLHVFYITINVEKFKGPGQYAASQADVQVTGPAGVQRWSNLTLPLRVDPGDGVQLNSATLTAEAGTGSSGIITVAGHARCGA